MKNNTKILSSETVFNSKYFYVEKATIQRDGKVIKKDILKRTSSVIILPIDENDEIYLVSQFRDSYQKVMLETVAGHIEEGESPIEAARKELKEEVGLTAGKWREIAKIHTSANINDAVHVFYATDLNEGDQDLDEDEDIDIVKVPFSTALEKVGTGEMQVSSNIASLLLLDKFRREGKI
jgi:ADP-ribose pyrophosphatase